MLTDGQGAYRISTAWFLIVQPASAMMDTWLRGGGQLLCRAAIKTPYLSNGKFDLEAYDAMVEHQIQVKTNCISQCCVTTATKPR